jgi:glycosyltransferase involved in cell wall biosynthesis
MEKPLISCIVPVFNGETYLGEALDSILAQTYQALEIIVADDGSTDGTPAIAARYGNQIRYFRRNNAGASAARNLGLSVARGEFVAFLDSDDLWHPEKLARQLARFHAQPGLDLCVTHVQNFWIPELKEEAERLRDHRIAQPLPGYVLQALLARRALFKTVGNFNVALLYAADATEWFVRAIEHGAVVELMPDVLVFRRLHRTNLTRQMASASREEYLQILKTILDRRRQKATSLQ